MLEFITVPNGAIMPHACVACAGSTGPLIDTHRELHGYGRVYVCQSCVRRSARVLGLVKGKRMDELAAAGDRLYTAEQEILRLQELLAASQQAIGDKNRELDAARRNEDGLRNRVAQLEQRARQHAEEWADLVGAAV